MKRRRAGTVVGIVLLASTLAGCGSSAGTTTAKRTSSARPSAPPTPPTVLAAASLTRVFPQIDPKARYIFGGSDALEIDVEQGAPADVFAAASPKQPAALYAKGLVETPVEFATNRLVLIVPRGNPAHIRSVKDITRPGVKLVICAATVPCGDYARRAFANLAITKAAMHNVVSQTTDVTQTVAAVAFGQADAGFVYITDARAAAARVRVIPLPAAAKPDVADFVAVVRASRHQAAAHGFLAAVLSASGQRKLRAAGFGRP
jgi:molybdate transport system substrate-binding protein